MSSVIVSIYHSLEAVIKINTPRCESKTCHVTGVEDSGVNMAVFVFRGNRETNRPLFGLAVPRRTALLFD